MINETMPIIFGKKSLDMMHNIRSLEICRKDKYQELETRLRDIKNLNDKIQELVLLNTACGQCILNLETELTRLKDSLKELLDPPDELPFPAEGIPITEDIGRVE